MNNKKKEIPTKNYIILIILSLVTLILTFNLAGIYQERMEYNNQSNNIMKFLSEIKEEELKNYVLDNHDTILKHSTIIYISSSVDNKNKKFEYQLRKYINRKNLTKDFVYIDSSNVSENFYNDLNNNFLSEKLKSQNIDLKTIPNILIVKEGKIVKVLYKKQPSKLKVKQAEDFIKKNWIDE